MENALAGTQALPEGETAANPGNETAPELNNDELDTNASQGENTEGGEGEGQGEEANANAEEQHGETAENSTKKLKFNDLPKWAIKRINDETNRRKDVERQLEEARRGSSAQPTAAEGGTERPVPAASADDEVERRAAQLLDQRAFQNRVNAWAEAGNRDFKDDFNDRCNLIAGLGAGVEFMQIVTDPDIVKDGHKVVAELADDPEEAQRILRLPPVKMAIELTRIGERISKPSAPAPKPISRVPAPVNPVGGVTKTTSALEDPDASQDDFDKEFHEMMAAKLKNRR
jgi:hypothetical protein